MTLQCQLAKKMRVESVKSAGQWDFGNLNNLADFMSGTAEVTGRTLKMVGLDAMSKAGLEVAKGTGKIMLGTGKMGVGIVMGTGKVASDVVVGTVVGTGRVATDVVVGTGKVGMEVVKGTGKVVVGTGQLLKTGTENFARGSVNMVGGSLKGIGKASRRITNIFSQGELIREDNLKESKDHLRPVMEQGLASAQNSPKGRKSRKQRRHTEMNRRGLSPLRDSHSARRSTLLDSSGSMLMDEDDAMDELTEMELFMQHLQDMDPEKVKRVLSDGRIQA